MKPRTIVYVDGFKFKLKQVRCGVPGCNYPGSRSFDVPEEKRTDVNIALQMMDDANHDRADQFIIVSGDSDLVPALEMVKAQWPMKRLVVYVPSRHPLRDAAVELRNAADKPSAAFGRNQKVIIGSISLGRKRRR